MKQHSLATSQWFGIWKDDKDRFVVIERYETPEGLSIGHFFNEYKSETQLYRDGNHTLDGSKLMERKRGEEKGWPK